MKLKNIRHYLGLMKNLEFFQKTKNEEKEDDTLLLLDHAWYVILSPEEREYVIKVIRIERSWRQYIKEGRHKKTKVLNEWLKKYDDREVYLTKSNLDTVHHVIYALIRNRPLAPLFKKSRNEFWSDVIYFLYRASSNDPRFSAERELVLKPFGNAITQQDLVQIYKKFEDIKAKTSYFTRMDLE